MRKSDRTRARILAAARERFAAEGFERTTIRGIALDADIDPKMVMRYFGSKDRLFAAAASVQLELPDLVHIRRETIGVTVVAHFLSLWEDSGSDTLLVLTRTAASNAAAAARMRRVFRQQVTPMLMRIIEGKNAERAAALFSAQLIGLAFCRHVLKLPPLANMPRAQLIAQVGRTLQAYIDPE
jgi:AcrR family transcriptional regulator